MASGVERATIFDRGEVCMAARQVILYFDDQKDALRFALAAGSVMAGEGETVTTEQRALIQETQRASRILLDEAVNTGAKADLAR
jgi:acyl-CoA reductase-like NAD-dependent aldehyde dehydrogenase